MKADGEMLASEMNVRLKYQEGLLVASGCSDSVLILQPSGGEAASFETESGLRWESWLLFFQNQTAAFLKWLGVHSKYAVLG